MKKRWKVNPINRELAEELGSALHVLPLTAQLLINRGLVDFDRAFSFLSPELADLHDPFLLSGMDLAVERVRAAMDGGEKIAIYGDYDVDGTTGTALLHLFFKELGVETLCYIPERLSEGYGLNCDALKGLAEKGVSLVITVDCGTSNFTEVEYASTVGVDCIVTDHHEPPSGDGGLPPAKVVLNPKKPGCTSPFKALAGVGVAFKLALAIRSGLRDNGFFKGDEPNLKKYLDLVCIGTVADMVPLTGENRVIVRHGMSVLNNTQRPGIRALIDSSCFKERVDTDDIAFKLAPRINAAGRLGSALAALKLLITDDATEAASLAGELEGENASRRSIEEGIQGEAIEMAEVLKVKSPGDRAFVFASSAWHQGVVGIVASRLVQRYSRPAVMIALDGSGIGRGSVRGVKGVDVLEGLTASSGLLERFGGHRLAAGLTIKEEHIPAFREEFTSFMNQSLTEEDLVPELLLDAEVTLDEVTPTFVNEIEKLSPFGLSNRKPLLMTRGAVVVSSEVVGQRHLRLTISQNGHERDCIAFNMAEARPARGASFDIAFSPYFDLWRGNKKLRLKVRELERTSSKDRREGLPVAASTTLG